MTKKQVLDFIQNYMQIAMQQIEQSHAQGHLIYSEDLFNKYDNKADFIKALKVSPESIVFGYTTSTYFEVNPGAEKFGQTMPFTLFYQLKKGCMPGDALNDILYKSTTIIDCLEAVNIAWYMCIRALLIKCYQEADGENKFNQLFNHENHPFIISQYDLYTLVGSSTDESLFASVPVLSYFVKKLHEEEVNHTLAKLDLAITPGARIILYNNTQYFKNNPMGHAGAINLVCVGKNAYRGFGLGDASITEEQVLEWLEQEYKKPPLEITKIWLTATAKLHSCNKNISIPSAGYFPDLTIDFDIDNIYTLTHDFAGALENIKIYILEYQSKQLIRFIEFKVDPNERAQKICVYNAYVLKVSALLDLLKDKNLIKHYQKEIKEVQDVLLRLTTTPSECTKKTLIASALIQPVIVPSCLELLYTLTKIKFKYSKKASTFWTCVPNETIAKEIDTKLKSSHPSLSLSHGKIIGSTEYMITVAMFDPKKTQQENQHNNALSYSF